MQISALPATRGSQNIADQLGAIDDRNERNASLVRVGVISPALKARVLRRLCMHRVRACLPRALVARGGPVCRRRAEAARTRSKRAQRQLQNKGRVRKS